ncbi:(pine wood nematode) hypothetical protein [Aphelenchoides besseyi]|nr:(pine wood nematode) hypothetical protein [Aphelenchoides besseyi]
MIGYKSELWEKTEQSEKMEGRDMKELLREAESFKRLTFFAIAISTVATLTAIIVVPMLYNYTQHVQASLDEELEFCTHRSNGLWDQYRHIAGPDATREKREAVHRAANFHRPGLRRQFTRQADAYGGAAPGSAPVSGGSSSAGGYGGASEGGVSSGGASSGGSSCSCGVGQAGPPGPPGPDGNNGNDGAPGQDGAHGEDAQAGATPSAADFCFDCPPGPPGPAGNAGPKGPNGNPGAPGQDGAPGSGSGQGPAGPPGPPGQPGNDGEAGQPGPAGQVNDVPGQAGDAGPNGPPGNNGAPGQPGSDGEAGSGGDGQYTTKETANSKVDIESCSTFMLVKVSSSRSIILKPQIVNRLPDFNAENDIGTHDVQEFVSDDQDDCVVY